jgi:hypothetical protein
LKRESDDHRDEDLTGGLRVTRDTVESRGSSAALAKTTTERGESNGERGTNADEALGIVGGGSCALRERCSAGKSRQHEGGDRNEQLGNSAHFRILLYGLGGWAER